MSRCWNLLNLLGLSTIEAPLSNDRLWPRPCQNANGKNSDDTCSRSEVRIIECGIWNIDFVKEDVV